MNLDGCEKKKYNDKTKPVIGREKTGRLRTRNIRCEKLVEALKHLAQTSRLLDCIPASVSKAAGGRVQSLMADFEAEARADLPSFG